MCPLWRGINVFRDDVHQPTSLAYREIELRLAHSEELGLNAVQIAGSDPLEMAQAAAINVAYGAEIIDINMAVPQRK